MGFKGEPGRRLVEWRRVRQGFAAMQEVTRLLNAVRADDPAAAAELLPLIYEDLRRLAAARMAEQPAGQTLQPTALVHEAWLRIAGGSRRPWSGLTP